MSGELAAAGIWQVGDHVAEMYEVRDVLGRGGMGVVHRVRHLGWNVDLAVKSPLPELVSSPVNLASFVQEAETWVELGLHPHVCMCHYVRTLDGVPRLFAEYVGAGSLREWIVDDRLYAGSAQEVLGRVLDIAIQSAWGLAHAHAQGFVHQDVKPANILLDDDGTAKISDFGLARSQHPGIPMAGTAAEGLTLHVTSGGMTPAYASPEQAARYRVGRRSDVWSLAVSLLEMIIGGITWRSGPEAGAALSALNQPTRVAVPGTLAELLARCLANDPANRPGMAEVAAELVDLYGTELGNPHPRQAPQPLEHRADELNNRALSLLDLDRVKEAIALFEEARAADPHHPELLYNDGLVRWRAAVLTDDALVNDLETSRSNSTEPNRVAELLARVQEERGAPESVVVLAGHKGDVQAVCTTPDGLHAVSAGRDGTVRMWDLATGELVRTLKGHPSHVMTVGVTRNGRRVLSAGNDDKVWVWDTDTGRLVRTLTGHAKRPNPYDQWTSLYPSPDGRQVLAGGWDRPVQLWDLKTGQLVRKFTGHTTFVSSVCITPDGRYALSGAGPGDPVVRVWDIETGECLRVLSPNTGQVYAVCATPDSRHALSATFNGTIHVWDIETGALLRGLIGHKDSALCVCTTPDGRYAITGGNDRTVRIWDIATGRCLRTLRGHTHSVNFVCVTPDGQRVLSASRDGTVRVWSEFWPPDRPSAFELCRPASHGDLSRLAAQVDSLVDSAEQAISEQRFPAALALLEEARATRGHAEHPRAREARERLMPYCSRIGLDGVRLAATLQSGSLSEIAVSNDGRLAVSAGDNRLVQIWELPEGRLRHSLTGHDHSVVSVCFTPDGRHALSACWDETIGMWDVGTGQLVHVLTGHTCGVYRVRVTPDGKYAVSLAQDGTTRVWDLTTGGLFRTLHDHTDSGYALDISPNGRVVLSTDDSGTRVNVWDLATGRKLGTLKGHTERVDNACITTDGRHALTASYDRTARLWDISTGKCLRTLTGHIDNVTDISITPDGRFALTGSGDNTARLWDLITGDELQTLIGHEHTVTSVRFTPDGRRALTSSYDGTLRIWDLDWRLTAHNPTDWAEAARPHFDAFLMRRALATKDITPFSLRWRLRSRPSWTDDDFDHLYRQLQHAGYGWLTRQGVHRQLEQTASKWKPRL